MASLVGISDQIKGQRYTVDKERVNIGRSHTNDIVLNHPTVSGQHCYISHRGRQYMIYDLNSTNGTAVSFKKIKQAELKPKDVVKIGSLELMFDTQDEIEKTQVIDNENLSTAVDNTPQASKPVSFSSVSPYGNNSERSKAIWITGIIGVGLLALVFFVYFIYKIFCS
jgi:pSer/pThr/pTyr-binding forkhead associated (FHA) protein